ncbi:hypothetical protein H0H93_009945 [Arthromyces matolae]|nr:hypothetical protein H0H93_009945 [Arthromyces matolae]
MKILDYETNIMVDGSNLTEYNMHYDDEEDDKYLNSQATEGLGTITVTIWRGFAGPEDDDPTFNNDPLFEGMIHERSKKATGQHKIG